MSANQSAEKDDKCLLCAQPRSTWPCAVSWDGEHRPLLVIPPVTTAGGDSNG